MAIDGLPRWPEGGSLALTRFFSEIFRSAERQQGRDRKIVFKKSEFIKIGYNCFDIREPRVVSEEKRYEVHVRKEWGLGRPLR